MKLILSLAFVMTSFSSMASTFSCFGTEPFWGVKISEQYLTYTDYDNKTVKLKVLAKKNAAGFAKDAAFVVKSKYSQASVALGECSDGMSDQIYSHTIVYQVNDTVLAGCCNQGK